MASRIQIQFIDKLRYSPAIRGLRCRLQTLKDRNPSPEDPQGIARSIHNLCTAARSATTDRRLQQVENRISNRVSMLNGHKIDWMEFEKEAVERTIESAVVIKPYVSPREKGVLLISFDYQWARLMQYYRPDVLEKLADRYELCVCTVWAEPHCLMNYLLPKAWPGKRIYATISDPNDDRIIPRFSDKYVIAPCSARTGWIPPGTSPCPSNRRTSTS